MDRKKVEFRVMQGRYGIAVYLNNHRLCGVDPGGSAFVLLGRDFGVEELLAAMQPFLSRHGEGEEPLVSSGDRLG